MNDETVPTETVLAQTLRTAVNAALDHIRELEVQLREANERIASLERNPVAKARSRTLMAAKNFSRLMAEFGGIEHCQAALTELLDAADQLETLEAFERRN